MDGLTIATFTLAFCTVLLAFVAIRSLGEAKKQRMDALRPLLVPLEGQRGISKEQVAYNTNLPGYLKIKNIGLGPATDITVALGTYTAKDVFEPIHSEILDPLGADDFKVVVQEKELANLLGHEVIVAPGISILILYQDAFGRSISTRATWFAETNAWIGIHTRI